MKFVTDIAAEHGVSSNHPLVRYLVLKTRAADRDSKSRRSFASLYTLRVLAEDHLETRTSRATDLIARIKALPFGSKLQNHALDNRLNHEFSRRLKLPKDLTPIRPGNVGPVISSELLSYEGAEPNAVARVIVSVVRKYIELITVNQATTLQEIQAIETLADLGRFFDRAFAANSDARLFEIASYVLLAEHYRGQQVFIGTSADAVQPQPLALFRTGRTNANDGGIDFVLRPLGRLFQVTETLDFRKYFLDFEKVNRYPISFVIKVNADQGAIAFRIRSDAKSSGRYSDEAINLYMSLFEEIFTLRELQKVAADIRADALERVKNELALQFKLEYGLLD